MPQSLDHVLIHVVFSTKNRAPLIIEPLRLPTHAYLATIARDLSCPCLRAGGTNDHVHLAIQLTRTLAIADLVEKLKTSSSKWLKTQSTDLRDFAWQRGYGVFSISPKDSDALIAYIDNQIEHHKTRTFVDEYRGFLKKYGIAFDERYAGINKSASPIANSETGLQTSEHVRQELMKGFSAVVSWCGSSRR